MPNSHDDIQIPPVSLALTDAGIEHQLSALGDAAIVGSVQDAVDLWIQHPRFSFITLEGDLLLASGLLKLGEKKDGLNIKD